MCALRRCISEVNRQDLLLLVSDQFFEDQQRPLRVKPSDLSINKADDPEHIAFAHTLFQFERAGLLNCAHGSLYQTFLMGGPVRLSKLGELLWERINKNEF